MVCALLTTLVLGALSSRRSTVTAVRYPNEGMGSQQSSRFFFVVRRAKKVSEWKMESPVSYYTLLCNIVVYVHIGTIYYYSSLIVYDFLVWPDTVQ